MSNYLKGKIKDVLPDFEEEGMTSEEVSNVLSKDMKIDSNEVSSDLEEMANSGEIRRAPSIYNAPNRYCKLPSGGIVEMP